VGLGVPVEAARAYEQRLDGGDVLVTVETPGDTGRAATRLREHAPDDLHVYRRA
jgi:hypothetical protein